MRQREWARCSDPEVMVDQLWRSDAEIGPRPFYLFVLTAGERLWTEPGSEAIRPAVEVAWRRADGAATDAEVAAEREQLREVYETATRWDNWHLARLVNVLVLLFTAPGAAARALVFPHPFDHDGPRARMLNPAELAASCRLMREFFADRGWLPFTDPGWFTSAVVGLARGIDEDRAYDRLPVLADALDDAGCTDKYLLAHCRHPGPHQRGCWAIDLLLRRVANHRQPRE